MARGLSQRYGSHNSLLDIGQLSTDKYQNKSSFQGDLFCAYNTSLLTILLRVQLLSESGAHHGETRIIIIAGRLREFRL